MLFKLAHSRIFGLLIGLAAATAATAAAQDTAAQGTTQAEGDTSQVQNPPGYRGMEQDTTQVPPGPPDDSLSAGQVEDKATGTHDDSTWQDTTAGRQNPAGYRGMERPVGGDTSAAGDTAAVSDTAAAGDTSSTGDTTGVGETESRTPTQPEARPPTVGRDTTETSGENADTNAPQ